MDKVGEYTLYVMKSAEWYNKWLVSFFKEFLRGKILEVGCGVGNFSSQLSEYGDVTSIDVNDKYVSKANYENKNINIGFGDIEVGKYFFNNKKFDSIICLNVLEHINNHDRALSNMYKLLNNNGFLIILVPAHMLLMSKFDKLLGHFRRYDIKYLKDQLISQGFTIKVIRYINWWGAIGWFIFIKLFNRREFPKSEVTIFNSLGKFLIGPERYIKIPFGLSVFAVATK